ncbi:uncharacterized protein LOC134702104 [Mytilus trossulus]|uniref:uncharacterized protein LOC134702104 n=1 Tax=Mytilus trossulus TaxID=6551 RepID=UPI003004C04B
MIDGILYGKVIKEKFIPGPADDIYNDSAIREYTLKIVSKMKGLSEGVGQDVLIKTAGNYDYCGVRFNVGESYILMGAKQRDGTKWIGMCDFPSQLSYMSSYQTFYLFTRGSHSYRYNCRRCQIDQTSVGCSFQSDDNCLAKKALCKREGLQCRWVNNGTC